MGRLYRRDGRRDEDLLRAFSAYGPGPYRKYGSRSGHRHPAIGQLVVPDELRRELGPVEGRGPEPRVERVRVVCVRDART